MSDEKPETIGELHDRLPKDVWVDLPEWGISVRAWPEPVPLRPTTCGHCSGVQRGYATAYRAGSAIAVPLCHPDSGLDCYRLVTVYGHHMPCPACADARLAGA